MRRVDIPGSCREYVRQRAHGLCEYCHTSEQWQYVPFTMEHVVPVVRGGHSTPDNLALACFHCNRRKHDMVTAVDPESGAEVPLFHPREQLWRDHFIWSADARTVIALTPIGRATTAALTLNRARILDIRAADHAAGRHPPPGDPVQAPEPATDPPGR